MSVLQIKLNRKQHTSNININLFDYIVGSKLVLGVFMWWIA